MRKIPISPTEAFENLHSSDMLNKNRLKNQRYTNPEMPLHINSSSFKNDENKIYFHFWNIKK